MKLQPLLSEYLLETGVLPLADSKQLSIASKTAVIREDGSVITPPHSGIKLSEVTTGETKQDPVAFISHQLAISPEQAAELLDKEGNFETAFAGHEVIDLFPFGQLQKQNDGTITFTQSWAPNTYLPNILLKRNKLQPNPETVAVEAETEIQSEAVYEFQEPPQKDKWWIWAIIILVVSAALIALRYVG